MRMTVGDLSRLIRAALRDQLPLAESPTVDRVTITLVDRILDREQMFADASTPATRAELLDRLERERYTPLPRREVGASLANLDTPDVVAARLKILREMPADSPEGE